MGINKIVNKHTETLFRNYPELQKTAENLYEVYSTLQNAFVNGKTLFLCGNGGSAADCEHISGELLKSFLVKRKVSGSFRAAFKERLGDDDLLDRLEPGLRTISLLGHPALTSAFANDVDPLYCYAQQVYVLGREGDVVLGISTSGGAKNIYECFRTARGLGMKTILLTGEKCGICEKYADVIYKAPAKETFRVQEYHLPVYHTLCAMLESFFYEN